MDTVLRIESTKQLVTHRAKLMKLHRADPLDEQKNRVSIGSREIATTSEAEHADGTIHTVMHHEIVETFAGILADSTIEQFDVWTSRCRIEKDEVGQILVTPLRINASLGDEPDPMQAPVNLGRYHTSRSALGQAAREIFGPDRQAATLAPVMKYWDEKFPGRGQMPSSEYQRDLLPYLVGAQTAADVAANCFGADNVRADVVKAVAMGKLEALRWALLLWDRSMPVDWAVAHLRQHQERDVLLPDWFELGSPFGKLIRGLDSKSRARLLKRRVREGDWRRGKEGDSWCVRDAMRNYEALLDEMCGPGGLPGVDVELPGHVRTWKEFEDAVNYTCGHTRNELARQSREDSERRRIARAVWFETADGERWLKRRNAAEQRKLIERQKAESERLDKLKKATSTVHSTYVLLVERLAAVSKAGDLRYVVAATQAQLREWSIAMRNCIAGYSADVSQTYTPLVGVYDQDERLVANISIKIDPRSGAAAVHELEIRRGRSYHTRWSSQIHRDLAEVLATAPARCA
ncbi:PcfJ domain-containing protein [Kribbella sp. NBC_01245]|uniref:hypothetical protein n=1 Tax=Kribbella sp. NBC_01245 TaxID=2903578 RepID=UPI002E283417|nr:hypothetical protein [Kribbella sp. NBC_01245]